MKGNLRWVGAVYLLISALWYVGVWGFDPASYQNSELLSPDYEIFWTADQVNNAFLLAVRAKTTGWVGFGIGEPTSGSMPGTDFLIMTVNGATQATKITDSFSLDFNTPVADECSQDWVLVSGQEGNGITVVEVSRKLVGLTDAQDRDIVPGKNKILFATGTTDSLVYHGTSRGLTSVFFYDPPGNSTIVETDVQTVDFLMGTKAIPPQFTTYMCRSFTFPNITDGSIVKFEPLIDNTSSLMVHHMLVHNCKNLSADSYMNLFDKSAGQCLSPVGFTASGCESVVFSWARGSQSLEMPKDVGFRIGTAVPWGITFLVIELHYTNPSLLKNVSDNSGVRVHFTPTTRPIDAGVMILGDAFASLPRMPPGSIVERETSCSSQCSQKWPHNITVFADFMHMHSFGKRIFTNQFRNEKRIRTTNRIDFWNYEVQEGTLVNYEIMPGDRLNTHCIYDTRGSSKDVSFGTSSNQEMCMNFLYYYPVLIGASNEPIVFCGAIAVGSDSPYTLCGTRSNSIDFLTPNPSIVDPSSQYPVTFGNAPCKISGMETMRPTGLLVFLFLYLYVL